MARLTPSGETTPTENPAEQAESTAEPDPEAAARKARKRATARAAEKRAAEAAEKTTEKTAEKTTEKTATDTPSTTSTSGTSGTGGTSGMRGMERVTPAGKATPGAASKTAPKGSTKGPSKASPNPAPKATTGTTGTGPAGPVPEATAEASTHAPRSAAAERATGTPTQEGGLAGGTTDAPPAVASAAGESAVEVGDDAVPSDETTGETSTETADTSAPERTSDEAVEAVPVGADRPAVDSPVAANMLTGADQARRAAVVAAEVFCVVGTLVGVGVLGTRVEESSGGALAADATLIAPAGPAFSIWTPIYLGLLGYTIWQAVPSNATRERTRATGWLAAASMVLNAVWLLVTQRGWIWVSVAVIALLAAVLGTLVSRLTRERASSTWERVLVDVTFGAYLGWVSVATAANVTAALVESGVDLGTVLNQVAAVLVVAVAALIGVFLASRLGGRWSVAAAMAWGLGWIAVGRFTGEPRSVVTGVAAAVAAAVVLAAAARFRGNGVVYHGRHS